MTKFSRFLQNRVQKYLQRSPTLSGTPMLSPNSLFVLSSTCIKRTLKDELLKQN